MQDMFQYFAVNGLGKNQVTCLKCLLANGPSTKEDILEYLDLDEPAISVALEMLVKRGWVSKKSHEDNDHYVVEKTTGEMFKELVQRQVTQSQTQKRCLSIEKSNNSMDTYK